MNLVSKLCPSANNNVLPYSDHQKKKMDKPAKTSKACLFVTVRKSNAKTNHLARKPLKKVPIGRTRRNSFSRFSNRRELSLAFLVCLLVHKAYFFPNIDQAITAPAPSKINKGVPESLLFGLTPRSAATSVGIKMLFFLLPS